MPEEHPVEQPAGEFVHEPQPVSAVPLSGTAGKDNTLYSSGLGAAFEGLSVISLEGKEKGKGGVGGDDKVAHNHESDTAFVMKPSPRASDPETRSPNPKAPCGLLDSLQVQVFPLVQLLGRWHTEQASLVRLSLPMVWTCVR